MNYVIVSSKSWHSLLLSHLKEKIKGEWFYIENKNDFTLDYLNKIKPVKIFIPHWSDIIPQEIYTSFECIVFHMTDLPFGRGGSPLQNLIVRGFKETKISALKVEKELDAGDIYLKKELSLSGTAEEIFKRASGIIEDMIVEIISHNVTPYPQIGEAVIFKRRKPEESNIAELDNLEILFDYIRMLDAEGYPNAFYENKYFRFEFTNAKLVEGKSIFANVRISKK